MLGELFDLVSGSILFFLLIIMSIITFIWNIVHCISEKRPFIKSLIKSLGISLAIIIGGFIALFAIFALIICVAPFFIVIVILIIVLIVGIFLEL